MPPQNKTIQDVYKQFDLDRLYAGKSSGDGESIVGAMQSQQRLASMPQGGAMQSLTPIGPIDFLAETAMTGASQMEGMNPLAMLLAGALAPGAYKKLKTTNTPALLKKFDVKVDNPLYHNTGIGHTENILKTGRVKAADKDVVSLTRNPEYSSVPGFHSSDLDVQIILDKKNITSSRGTRVKPYVYKATGSLEKKILAKEISETKNVDLGSPLFGKPSPWFEAEERVFSKKGIPAKNIKAIKIRNTPEGSKVISDKYPGETDLDRLERMRAAHKNDALLSLLKTAGNKKIPVIIEPAAEEGVMGLLDLMNPKQQSKVLKREFAGLGNLLRTKKKIKNIKKEGFVEVDEFGEYFSKQPYMRKGNPLQVEANIKKLNEYMKKQKGMFGDYSSKVLEFEVPKSYINKFRKKTEKPGNLFGYSEIFFPKGIPKQFLKKVHK
jgi:hypothetical protein